jgi:hypothetical protein
MEYFLGHNGVLMAENIGCDFSHKFDWIVTQDTIIKKKDIPNSIYVKIDYLPRFAYEILPTITNRFLLITGCGDASPQLNFNAEYNVIIDNPFLIHWYMENMYQKNNKISSLPVGLATHTIELEETLLEIRNKTINNNKKEKIFCCWHDRSYNICGSVFNVRGNLKQFVKQFPNSFDVYEHQMDLIEFLTLLSQYQYAFCPHGNGIDPNPTAWYCLALGVTPIVLATANAKDMFKDINSVIFIKDPNEIIDCKIKLSQVDINFLTSDYWAKKILNHSSTGAS